MSKRRKKLTPDDWLHQRESRAKHKGGGPDWDEARVLAKRVLAGETVSSSLTSTDGVWALARRSALGFADSWHGGLLMRGMSRAEAGTRRAVWIERIRKTFDIDYEQAWQKALYDGNVESAALGERMARDHDP
jgi:hypothetical protein